MKSLLSFAAVVIAIFTTSAANAQSKTETFKVYGNCNMCKNRIEKALLGTAGISQAKWDVQTKILKVIYDSSKVSNDKIQQRIAAVGHDTEKHKAADTVYEKLPGCCQYDRSNAAPASPHKHH
jgi:mercuric ion binding protein